MSMAGTSPDDVIHALTQTALHTLNVYGNDDPAGEYILQGLNRLVEMTGRLCWSGAEVDAYRNAVAKARETSFAADTRLMTKQRILSAYDRLRALSERPDAEEEGRENIRDAVDYFRDFWETSDAAI